MKTSSFISVVVPVYNVAEYIDGCMESLVRQTYTDFEVILINDGSTDGSLDRCRAWAERDSRIRVYDQENRGVAESRNRGVDLAEGGYIAFVDPDDVVDDTYLEKLYTAVRDNDADYAECDLWRWDGRTGKKILRTCYGVMGVPYTLREHMKYGPTACYKSLFRRSLWTDNGIRMPSCSFESPAVYSLVLALAHKVVNVREPLYSYRRFRENSLIETGYSVNGEVNNTLALDAMRFLISEFRRTGLYETYQDDLEGIVKYRLNDILALTFHRRDEKNQRILADNYRAFLKETFPAGHNEDSLIFGGYNLNRILLHTDLLEDPYCRFNFSSIISLLKPAHSRPEITHRNRYRQMMIERDLRQAFPTVLAEFRPAYLFLDLIEERFDILEYEDRFITCSDALEGIEERELFAGARRIPYDSEERKNLFREAWKNLVSLCGTASPGTRIIVIENYLSEKTGSLLSQREFAGIGQIRSVNRVLREYYDFIRTDPRITVVPAADLKEYFTDENYEYGAVPSHLNEIVNRKIAERIRQIL